MTPEAIPPIDNKHLDGGTILVLVSSFRDPRCGQTLYNIFDRAAKPHRMHVAIVDQQLSSDKFDCVALYCALIGSEPCPHLDRIQTLRVDAAIAEGPLWARGLGTQMVKSEHDFCLQIDAHTDFRKGYDELTLRTWAMTGNEYAVLSTYVGNLKQDLNDQGQVIIGLPGHEIPVLCRTVVGGHNLVRNHGADGTSCQEGPPLSGLWGAGLSFAKCHYERNVPNDPRLAGLFDGEEFSRTIRGFTWGYDIYTMHRPTVFHDYGGFPSDVVQGGALSWTSRNAQKSAEMWRAIIFEGKDKGTAWGLGTLRTVEQYTAMTDIDPRRPGASDQEARKRCGKLKFVQYENDPSRLTAPLPKLGSSFPSHIMNGTSPLPQINPKFIAVARRMRELKNESPLMSPETQLWQYGLPPPTLWQDAPRGSMKQPRQQEDRITSRRDGPASDLLPTSTMTSVHRRQFPTLLENGSTNWSSRTSKADEPFDLVSIPSDDLSSVLMGALITSVAFMSLLRWCRRSVWKRGKHRRS